MELREIAADVHVCLQEDKGLGCSNSGFVNRAGGLVIDTFWDLPRTRRMIELYGTVSPTPAARPSLRARSAMALPTLRAASTLLP